MHKTAAPPPLQKTFAEAVREGAMARAPLQNRLGKRHPVQEDWMEEDDLLGADLERESKSSGQSYTVGRGADAKKTFASGMRTRIHGVRCEI